MTHAPSEIGMLRLAAHGLLDHTSRTPAQAVQHLGAAQAQMLPGALRSIALRSAPGTRESVTDTLNHGEIVKTWPMRGTIHLIPATDLPWMIELTASRMLSAYRRRRRELGLDEDVLHRAEENIRDALTQHGSLTREEVISVWRDTINLGTAQGNAYHSISYLHHTGVLCHGPYIDGEQHIVLASAWVKNPTTYTREEARAQLARRFFRSHGPATLHDFARWTNLTMRDVRAGVGDVADEFDTFSSDGSEYLVDPELSTLLAKHREQAEAVHLLPGFDEFILGYKNRDDVLEPEHAQKIVPGGNGMFRNTIVFRGRVIGTWKVAGSGANQRIVSSLFDESTATPQLHAEIEERFQQLP